MKVLSAAALEAFSAPLTRPEADKAFAAAAGRTEESARFYLTAIVNEAQTALRLLDWAGLQPGQRVLEVGAGGGLLTAYLQSNGVDLTAIEPVGSGFESTMALAKVVREAVGFAPKIQGIAARELDPAQHGQFDLIFSINVVEHFQPLTENLDRLAQVMAPGGVQAHTCPNYRIPYEPHYNIPLVPFAPQLTPYLMRRDVRAETVWQSLNFITASDFRALARRYDLAITFKENTFADTFERLITEPAFAERHPKALLGAAQMMRRLGIVPLLRMLPPTLATPMVVMLRRGASAAAA